MKCAHFTCHSCHDACAHIKSLVAQYKSIPIASGSESFVRRFELRNAIWEAVLKLVPDEKPQEEPK